MSFDTLDMRDGALTALKEAVLSALHIMRQAAAPQIRVDLESLKCWCTSLAFYLSCEFGKEAKCQNRVDKQVCCAQVIVRELLMLWPIG